MIYKRIRGLREEKNISQTIIGNGINVTQRNYSYYENGERMIPPDVLCDIADFYEVSVDYILGRTDVKNPYPISRKYKNN